MADWGKSAPDGKYWNKELETLPREQLEAKQLEDLKESVKFAYENAPYYKRSFDEAQRQVIYRRDNGIFPTECHQWLSLGNANVAH